MKRFSRPAAFLLAFFFTLVLSVGALAVEDYGSGNGVFSTYGIIPLSSVSGYDVTAFVATNNRQYFTTNVIPGRYAYYGANIGSPDTYGFYVTLPPSSVPGFLDIVGLYPMEVSNATTLQNWVYGDISVGNDVTSPAPWAVSPVYTFLSSSVSPFVAPASNGSIYNQSVDNPSFHVYIPSHSATLYLLVYSGYMNNGSSKHGVVYLSDGFISFTPDPAFQSQTTLQSILSVVQDIASGGSSSPVDSLVGGWSDKFQGQISQVEDALSPSNPALPNGGDIGGFVTDVSDGLGLSGSSFSSSDFNEATSAFSGSASTGTGGPWEFFTQGVADDLSGDSPMGIDDDYDPIIAWMQQAERWRDAWASSNP